MTRKLLSRGRFLCLLTLGALAQQAPAQENASAIERIRSRFAAINQSLHSYDTVSRRVDDFAVEGTEVVGYFDGGALRKLVASYFAESGFAKEEYYFWDGRVFFVFRQKQRGSQTYPELEGVDENRFYFESSRLIRWIDENQRLVVVDQPAARYEAKYLLSQADTLVRILGEPPSIQSRSEPATRSKPARGGPITADGKARARLAAEHETALRSEGCRACRAWVGGNDNQTLFVLDQEAGRGENDYLGTPVFWYGVGFTEVVYYSSPGVVYARHKK